MTHDYIVNVLSEEVDTSPVLTAEEAATLEREIDEIAETFPKVYIVMHPTEDEFVKITHGESGYIIAYGALGQLTADSMNELAGVTAAEVQAAVTCSMFNTWEKFDKIVNATVGDAEKGLTFDELSDN